MKTYGFFSNVDSSRDIIAKCKSNTLVEAIEYFAKIKNLSVPDFIKLYIVTNEI
jgi:hypothetical protein